MSKGWTGESSRHAMARMGIRTGNKKLSIVPTNVPRGSGNNPSGGKRDLHYKIKEWGYVFPTKKDAEKYAKEHEEKNGVITKVINVSPASEEQYLRNKIKFVGGYSPAEAEGIIYLITKKHKSEKEVFDMTKRDLEIASWNTPKGEWLQFDGQEVWTNALGKKFGERVCIGFDETGYFYDGKHYPMPSKKIRKEIIEEKFTTELGSPAQRRKDLEAEFGVRK